MPLPKINTPTYELVLPSSGKKVKYRPFLVREEKILIMALESEDMNQISNGVVQILNDCIITKGVKVESLATFDIEYLFLNIRAKSVGETVDVQVTCPDDNKTSVQVSINIDSRFRGNGFSYFLLENCLKKLKNYKKLKFIATVRKENLASIKCFTKCGFLLETEDNGFLYYKRKG